MYRTIFQPIFIIVSLLFFSFGAFAETVHNQGKYKYSHGNIVLSGIKPRIYLLKNISHQRVLVNQQLKSDPGASAGWASMILPNHWSAILMNEPSFIMTCQAKNKKSNILQQVNCKHWVQVVPVKKFTTKGSSVHHGSYWIAENMPFKALKKRIDRRGIKLKWPF